MKRLDDEQWSLLRRKPVLWRPNWPRPTTASTSILNVPNHGGLLYSICQADSDSVYGGLSAGRWMVRMIVEHPPTGRKWKTDPKRVTLECPRQGEGDTGTSTDAQ